MLSQIKLKLDVFNKIYNYSIYIENLINNKKLHKKELNKIEEINDELFKYWIFNRNNFKEEEVILIFNLYCKTTFSIHYINNKCDLLKIQIKDEILNLKKHYIISQINLEETINIIKLITYNFNQININNENSINILNALFLKICMFNSIQSQENDKLLNIKFFYQIDQNSGLKIIDNKLNIFFENTFHYIFFILDIWNKIKYVYPIRELTDQESITLNNENSILDKWLKFMINGDFRSSIKEDIKELIFKNNIIPSEIIRYYNENENLNKCSFYDIINKYRKSDLSRIIDILSNNSLEKLIEKHEFKNYITIVCSQYWLNLNNLKLNFNDNYIDVFIYYKNLFTNTYDYSNFIDVLNEISKVTPIFIKLTNFFILINENYSIIFTDFIELFFILTYYLKNKSTKHKKIEEGWNNILFNQQFNTENVTEIPQFLRNHSDDINEGKWKNFSFGI